MFENIIGYDYVKKELELIISWYNNEIFLNNKNAKLPGGIIFNGPPGNGKTYFIREILKQFKDTSFVIEGDDDNVLEEITNTYASARKNKVSIVLIDELDLLIEDKRVVRVLQDELDGINKNGERILTIASTNNLDDIPEVLRRNGRFDRNIFITRPEDDEKKEILEYYFNKLGVKLNIKDYNKLLDNLGHRSCAELVSLCNDCYLRYYGEEVNEDKIYDSLSLIDPFNPLIRNNDEKREAKTAYHEIGHALLVLKYKEYFKFLGVRFSDSGAFCEYHILPEEGSIKSEIRRIEIALGGIVVEKIFYGDVFDGSGHDLENARGYVNYLVNRYPYSNITNVLRRYNDNMRMETEKMRYKNEKIGNKLFKKCYRNAYKYILKHKEDIIKYGDLLIEKGRLVTADFEV